MQILRNKKFIICCFAFIFLVVTVLCFVSVFSVKRVDATFSVTAKNEAGAIEAKDKLNKYLNSSLLFLNTDDVVKEVESNPYFRVDEIKKVYPNSLEITVTERLESYYALLNGEYFVLDEDGFCLAKCSYEYVCQNRLIALELVNLAFNQIKVGESVTLSFNGEALSTILEMSKTVNLTDCIKSVTLYGKSEYAVFKTYTGVRIDIYKYFSNDGVKMIEKAFQEYNGASDYIRTYNRIVVYTLGGGEIVSYWTNTTTDYE